MRKSFRLYENLKFKLTTFELAYLTGDFPFVVVVCKECNVFRI